MSAIRHFAKVNLRMEDKAEALVNAWINLTQKYTAKKVKNDYVADHDAKRYFSSVELTGYEKDSADFNEMLMKYCVEASGFEWNGIEMVKEPQVRNRAFMDRFYAITSQVLTPVIPAVVSTSIMNLAEVKDIALGDTAQFIVKSNELFQVNEFAEGIHMGAAQRLYNEETVVNPTLKEVRVDVDWYWVATGKVDFGEWAYKVGVSFGAYINKLIYKTMVDSIASIPAAFKANGFTDTNWLNIAQRVEAANAGSKCYTYGTKVALGSILPSNDYLKFQLGEEWTKVGYIAQYKGTPVMEIDQILVPGTFNSTATFGIDDTYLWFMPMGGYKPVKLVFEGSAWTTADDSTKTADKTQNMVIQRRMGVKLIIGSRFGVITL